MSLGSSNPRGQPHHRPRRRGGHRPQRPRHRGRAARAARRRGQAARPRLLARHRGRPARPGLPTRSRSAPSPSSAIRSGSSTWSGGSEPTVSRVRRGDVDLVAHETFVLAMGDRLLSPRPPGGCPISALGDSDRGMSDINVGAKRSGWRRGWHWVSSAAHPERRPWGRPPVPSSASSSAGSAGSAGHHLDVPRRRAVAVGVGDGHLPRLCRGAGRRDHRGFLASDAGWRVLVLGLVSPRSAPWCWWPACTCLTSYLARAVGRARGARPSRRS